MSARPSETSVARPSEASVVAVRENLVTIAYTGRMTRNEVAFIHAGERRLKAELLRVRGHQADLQVFEETRGVRVGDTVELTGEMLSVSLGPGLLGQVFDGLQAPLHAIAVRHGVFLQGGDSISALDEAARWPFQACVRPGDEVVAGAILGTVPERHVEHRIMVPFGERGRLRVEAVQSRLVAAHEVIASLAREDGSELQVRLSQRWPVRVPLAATMLATGRCERLYPAAQLVTTLRLIDTFFPIAKGGTACIPGPFGAGKTVLQNLLARYADVDVVVIVACGERAGEVVETIHTFPELNDPRTGGQLIDRTIIVCNTSSMPVAARESSIYTGMTLGEYYRAMGHDVLVIADSTSRWAQALRETSGRMEEIPGEEGYPAYLDSAIKAIYERAGALRWADGRQGSLTMIGTVSPAGGNLDEPVTQATLGITKTFLALSSERAYRRCYPAIDPLVSWSRYHAQLAPWRRDALGASWLRTVDDVLALLRRADGVDQMMQVTGESGVSLDDYVLWLKARLIDLAYLQQDARDPVDVSTSLARQGIALGRIRAVLHRAFSFRDKDEARRTFDRLTGVLRNLNYAPAESEDERRYADDFSALLAEPTAEATQREAAG